jgi:hypothetical protein
MHSDLVVQGTCPEMTGLRIWESIQLTSIGMAGERQWGTYARLQRQIRELRKGDTRSKGVAIRFTYYSLVGLQRIPAGNSGVAGIQQ